MTGWLRAVFLSGTAALSSIAFAWNERTSAAPGVFAAFKKDRDNATVAADAVDDELQAIARDNVIQCMKDPTWNKYFWAKGEFGGLKAFWTACPELVDRSKTILKNYLAAIYVRYPYGYYDGVAYISSRRSGRELFFSTKELVLAKEEGLLTEDAVKHQMCCTTRPDELTHWVSDKDLRQQLETVFPEFVYPDIVYKAIDGKGSSCMRYYPIYVLAKDPCPERRIRNIVKHVQDGHEWNEKSYTEFLYTHPHILKAYLQSAEIYLEEHPNTTELPFFARWYLKHKDSFGLTHDRPSL